jgi:hypothetical protein
MRNQERFKNVVRGVLGSNHLMLLVPIAAEDAADLALVDAEHRMIAGPLPRRALAHRVPARLVLAVIMAAADRKVVFRPDDLRSSIKAARL